MNEIKDVVDSVGQGIDTTLRGIWSALNSAGLKSIKSPGMIESRTVGLKLQPPKTDPYERSYDEIIAIQQAGSRGFKVVDIEPYILDRYEFYPVILESDLVTLVGSELDVFQLGFPQESDHLPFWRTVELPLNANWIKIEYLPSGQNDYQSFSTQLRDETEYPTFPRPSNPSITDTLGTNWTVKNASERVMLIQFDSTQATPMIAKHGEVYRLPFNTAYLTMKIWSPKIRVTAGYNAEIESVDDRHLTASPAYGPGHGLLNNPYLHSVPFCISNKDVGNIETTGGSTTEDLIVNVTQTNNQNGLFVGWITGAYYDAFATAVSAASPPQPQECEFDVFIATYPGLTPIRKLLSIPLSMNVADRITGSVVYGVANADRNFIEPLRFTLHKAECLLTRFSNSTTDLRTNHRFSLEGYTFGNMSSSNGSNLTPFVPQYKLTQEPYPQDRNYTGAPNK